jgi:hypothetical protein
MAFKLGDFTAPNAFFMSDVSLAVYAGDDFGITPYSLLLIDSAGKTASGFIGATGGVSESVTESVNDGAMENWTSATNLTSWHEAVSGTSTVNREGTEKHGGTYSCRLDIDASNSSAYFRGSVTLGSLGLYRLSFWYKTAAGKTASVSLRDTGGSVWLKSTGAWAGSGGIVLPASTVWTQYTLYFNAHASYTSYYLSFTKDQSASSSIYYDDVKCERITDPDSTGVHIVDGYGSTDRGWASYETGFEPEKIVSLAVLLNGVPIGWGGGSLNLGIKL